MKKLLLDGLITTTFPSQPGASGAVLSRRRRFVAFRRSRITWAAESGVPLGLSAPQAPGPAARGAGRGIFAEPESGHSGRRLAGPGPPSPTPGIPPSETATGLPAGLLPWPGSLQRSGPP